MHDPDHHFPNRELRQVRALLRLEGLATFAVGIFGFFALSDSWLLLLATFLLPDLSMAGYAFGPRIGARCYNLVHNYATLAVLAGFSVLYVLPALPLACVWLAHIGFDRALGFGLKLETGFRDTHLGRIGHAAANIS